MMSRPPPNPDFSLRGSDGPVTCITFWEKHLLAGTQQGTVSAWSLRTRRVVWSISAHQNLSVLKIAILRDHRLLTQGRDGWIHIWDSTTASSPPTKLDSMECSHLGFCGVCVLQYKGHDVIANPIDNKSEICFTSISDKSVMTKLCPGGDTKAYGMVMAMCSFQRDDQSFLLVGYEAGGVSLWDIASSQEISSHKFFEESVMCLDYCPETNFGVTGSVGQDVHSFTLSITDDQTKITPKRSTELVNPGVGVACVRQDGKICVTGGWDGRVKVFSGKSFKLLAVLSAHNDSIQSLAFSEDNTLAAGSKDKIISLWSIYK